MILPMPSMVWQDKEDLDKGDLDKDPEDQEDQEDQEDLDRGVSGVDEEMEMAMDLVVKADSTMLRPSKQF